jgi:hypothetical protein
VSLTMQRLVFAFVVVLGAIAIGRPTVMGGAAVAQEGGCTLSRRDVNARTGEPIAGMRKTLIETGEVTQTDADGVWSFRVAGAGTYTVASLHPDYEPVTRRYVLNAACEVTSATVATGGAGGVPTVTPVPSVAPTPGALPAGAQRFGGAVTIEGQPAPAGTRINAYVGETLCGSGAVAPAGRYSVDVLPVARRSNCALATSAIQFAVTPAFGEGWRLGGSAPFQAGAATQRDLAVDLARLRPVAENVPWIDVEWENPRSIAIGICGEIAPTSEEAVRGALDQWDEAFRDRGLVVALVRDGDAACGEQAPGIAIIEDDIRSRTALAGASHRTAALRPCPRTGICAVFKGLIVINRPNFARIDAVERANVLAHEIGHALGLDHALSCNGGTIMWADTQCRHPLRAIGVDDIASLNAKVGAVIAKSDPAAPTALEQPATDTFVLRPRADGAAAEGLRAGAAPILARLPDAATLLDSATVPPSSTSGID